MFENIEVSTNAEALQIKNVTKNLGTTTIFRKGATEEVTAASTRLITVDPDILRSTSETPANSTQYLPEERFEKKVIALHRA